MKIRALKLVISWVQRLVSQVSSFNFGDGAIVTCFNKY